MNAHLEFLRNLFLEWHRRSGATGDPDTHFETIRLRYSRPKRPYHSLDGHICACFWEYLEISPSLIRDRDTFEPALLLHDAVMDFGRQDNERRTSAFALELCLEMGFEYSFGDRIARLIGWTDHRTVPYDEDVRFLIDIDLSILGKDKETFDRYEKAIREEYSFVDDETYRNGRSAVLLNFLPPKRPKIFLTDHFVRLYERSARDNLRWSLEQLSKR